MLWMNIPFGASTILFVLIWSYFSSFYLYFFPLSYSLSLALATVVSMKIPDQNLIPYPENPILLCYLLTICIANCKILHLGRVSLAPVWSVGRMAQEQFLLYKQDFYRASEDTGIYLYWGLWGEHEGVDRDSGRDHPLNLLFTTVQVGFPGGTQTFFFLSSEMHVTDFLQAKQNFHFCCPQGVMFCFFFSIRRNKRCVWIKGSWYSPINPFWVCNNLQL